MTVSEIKKIVTKSGSHFFSRDSMKFFGDKMSSFSLRTIQKDCTTYMYRKPSAMVKPMNGWTVCGRDFFGCWEFDGERLNRVDNIKKEEIFQIVENK